MKLHTTIALIIYLLSEGSLGVCPQGNPSILKKDRKYTMAFSYPSVVMIESECALCTGFVVRRGVIATAAHCTRFLGEHQQAFINGVSKTFVVVWKPKGMADYTKNDVALLTGDTANLSPLALANRDLETGRCGSMGWGGRADKNGHQYSKITLCRLTGQKDNAGLLLIQGDVDHGDSGGPVLTEEGKVIGINESIAGYDIPLFWATPVSSLKRALRELK
jgi:V8-like Glu-specific endopeptidase